MNTPWPHMPNLIQLVQGTEQVLPTAMTWSWRDSLPPHESCPAAEGVAGDEMLTHGPSYGGLQEIGMLTLIEEPVGGSASRRPVEDRGDTPF